jgi:hypothetical protein
LPLREGVTWHDGKPFTATDVACTFDLLTGKSSEKLRVNPRKSWYRNLERVTTNGDYEVTFPLERLQPAFLTALASGFSPIYPCHCRHATCASTRSAPARSNSSSSHITAGAGKENISASGHAITQMPKNTLPAGSPIGACG